MNKTIRKVSSQSQLLLTRYPADRLFFTADTHFGYSTIIQYCSRPFRDVEEMNSELIRLWNETVPDDGIVFHLGDFGRGSANAIARIVSQLNGEVHLIAGNHDASRVSPRALPGFASIREQRLIDVDGQKIYLNHFPFLCYGGAYSNVWQLFGHVHSRPISNSDLDTPRLHMLFPSQYDVGVDNNGYRPVSFAQVKAKIEERVLQVTVPT